MQLKTLVDSRQVAGGIGWGHEHKNLQYLQNGARYQQGYYGGLISRITRFRFVPKSMTLDDLERPKLTLAEKSFYRAHQKNLNENRPI